MSDQDRGPYTPQSDAPLAFDPRQSRGGGGGPAPMTLLVSAIILMALIVGVLLFYRHGVRHPDQPATLVGAPVAETKSAPSASDATSGDQAAGLQVYKSESTPSSEGRTAPAPMAIEPPMLREIMPFGDNRAAPSSPVARYVVGTGEAFVLDRSAEEPLLKFEDSPEIWVLEPGPAPRGDIVYRNDLGEMVLRATRLGGVILFTPKEPEGAPAAMVGEADDLQPAPEMAPGTLLQKMIQASVRASRAAQHLITFDAPSVTPRSAPVFADAAMVAAEAVVRLSRRADGKGFVSRLEKIVFLPGRSPDASFNGSVMQVTVAATHGLAGRPSSARLARSALGR